YDLNANRYSYFSFLANFSLFFLIELKKRRVYILLSVITISIGIYASFYTASRSGIIFTAIPALIYWLFIYQGKIYKFIKYLLIPIVVYLGYQELNSIYADSYLQTRVEYSVSQGDSRELIAADAINVFLDNPVLGIGPAQYRFSGSYNTAAYSHNSF